MIDRLLSWLAGQIARRPGRIVLFTTLPCLALGAVIAVVEVDMAFMSIMDPEAPLVARFNQGNTDVGLSRKLLLLLEGPDEALQPAVDALVPALDAIPEVEQVMAEPPTEWLRQQAPYLVERDLFDAWVRAVTHPQDEENARRLKEGMEAATAQIDPATTPGARLVFVLMALDPVSAPMGDNGFPEIDEATQAALADTGVTGEYAGLAAMAQQDQASVLNKISTLTPLSLALVLALLLFVERRPLRLAAVATPMVLAMCGTLGLVGLIAGKLTAIEAFFGLMVFGLGVDFGLHLIVRQREERAAGHGFDAALRRTLEGAGRGIVAGALTSTGAFVIVAAAPDPIAWHLGLSGAIGLLLCLVLMLSLLPSLWTLLDRRRPARAPRALVLPLLAPLAGHAIRHPWLHLGAGALLIAGAVAGFGRFAYEVDLEQVFTRDVPAVITADRIQELYDVNTGPWTSLADDLEEARALTAAYEAEATFERVESAAKLFPADMAERHQVLQHVGDDIAGQRNLLAALRAMPVVLDAEALRAGVELLDVLAAAAAAGPPTTDDLPEIVRAQLMAPDGRFLVQAYSATPTLHAEEARAQRLVAESIDPDASSFVLAVEGMLLAERPWAIWVLVGILAFVAVVLTVDLRDPRRVVMALAPVVFGTSVTFGALCWLGVEFNVMGVLMVPLIIGLGVDDGIHVVHRIREHDGPPDEAAVSVGRAIVMTTLTTCFSVSVFILADHPGLELMALVMMLGLPLCLLASITLVPALAVVMRVR
jgi:uncharacterized protein